MIRKSDPGIDGGSLSSLTGGAQVEVVFFDILEEMQNRTEIIKSKKKLSFSKIKLQLTFASRVKDINRSGKIPWMSMALLAY
jgi:hypothetical protein